MFKLCTLVGTMLIIFFSLFSCNPFGISNVFYHLNVFKINVEVLWNQYLLHFHSGSCEYLSAMFIWNITKWNDSEYRNFCTYWFWEDNTDRKSSVLYWKNSGNAWGMKNHFKLLICTFLNCGPNKFQGIWKNVCCFYD